VDQDGDVLDAVGVLLVVLLGAHLWVGKQT
jgi:hypothetical protein